MKGVDRQKGMVVILDQRGKQVDPESGHKNGRQAQTPAPDPVTDTTDHAETSYLSGIANHRSNGQCDYN